MAVREHVPVALKNSGENVCFFNSVIQILYSLLEIRLHVLSTALNNNVITQLRRLFRKMQSDKIVHTYPIVLDLHMPQYHNREQIDASEVVSYLLENCYETRIEIDQVTNQIIEKPDYGLFKVNEVSSIMCIVCNKETLLSLSM